MKIRAKSFSKHFSIRIVYICNFLARSLFCRWSQERSVLGRTQLPRRVSSSFLSSKLLEPAMFSSSTNVHCQGPYQHESTKDTKDSKHQSFVTVHPYGGSRADPVFSDIPSRAQAPSTKTSQPLQTRFVEDISSFAQENTSEGDTRISGNTTDTLHARITFPPLDSHIAIFSPACPPTAPKEGVRTALHVFTI